MSAIQVKCNVMVENVKWVEGLGIYMGKFIYQQIEPLDKIYISQNGVVNLKKIGVTDPVDVTYVWLSNAVEIEGDLYPAYLADPVTDSFLIVPGTGKPGFGNKPPVNGDEIVVEPSGSNGLVMKDKNTPMMVYTYNLAVRVDIDGGKWLIDDPRIINTGVDRMLPIEQQSYS